MGGGGIGGGRSRAIACGAAVMGESNSRAAAPQAMALDRPPPMPPPPTTAAAVGFGAVGGPGIPWGGSSPAGAPRLAVHPGSRPRGDRASRAARRHSRAADLKKQLGLTPASIYKAGGEPWYQPHTGRHPQRPGTDRSVGRGDPAGARTISRRTGAGRRAVRPAQTPLASQAAAAGR